MDTVNTPPRREFLRRLGAGSLAFLALPSTAGSIERLSAPADLNDERYWELVKAQFAVSSKLVMCNAANLCPSPMTIANQVQSFHQGLSKDVSFQYRATFAELRSKSIAMFAEFLGVTPAEIGITRNTSEANCTLVNGLEFNKGDEILLWDQNHPSNKEAWEMRARRTGVVVKRLALPSAPSNAAELVDAFAKAITPKTRLLAFSHLSNISGLRLPAKDLCMMARSRGVLSLVDGAQTLGYQNVNLREMGCDFFTSSTHKWLMGPLENGILYVRSEHIEKVWPNIIGGGWHDNTKTVDEKVCFLGQRNDATTAALPETITFHQTIGRGNIEARVNALGSYLRTQIQNKVSGAKLLTPVQSELNGGVVVFNLPGKEAKDVVQRLYADFGVAGAATGGVRLSPHVYNTMADVDRVVNAVVAING